MTETPRTPIGDAEREMIDGWIAWVADHLEPPAPMGSHGAIMNHLDGLMAQPFIRDYGAEEHFALGVAWGEALRMANPSWVWVTTPTEGGATVALDLSADPTLGDGASLLTPGHLFAKRATMPGAVLEPREMERMLMEELRA